MRRITLVAALGAGLLLSACSAPTQQYVSTGSLGMYFSLPREWRTVPSRQLSAVERGWTDDAGNVFQQTVKWQGAWSAGDANANTVLGAKPTEHPIVFAFVRDLVSAEQSSIAGDVPTALQDLVLPTSSLPSGTVSRSVVTSSKFTGIRQRATYASGGALQTTEVLSMLAPRKDRVYAVVARCSARCFATNRSAISALFRSITFKEPRA